MQLCSDVDIDEVFEVMPLFRLRQNGDEVFCCHLHAVIPVDTQLVTVVWPQVSVEDRCTVENNTCIIQAKLNLAALAHFGDVAAVAPGEECQSLLDMGPLELCLAWRGSGRTPDALQT